MVLSLAEFKRYFDSLPNKEHVPCSLGVFPVAKPSFENFTPREKTIQNGLVTSFFDDGGLINDYIYFRIEDFDQTDKVFRPSVGSRLNVQAVQKRKHGLWTAKSISLVEEDCENEEDWDGSKFKIATSHEEKGYYIGVVLNFDDKNKCWLVNDGLNFTADDIKEKHFSPEPFDWIRASVEEGGFVKQVEPLRKSMITGTVTRNPRNENEWGKINDNIFYNAWNFPGQNFRKGDLVNVSVVETKFKSFSWRAISIETLQRYRKSTSENQEIESTRSDSQWVLSGVRPEFKNRREKIPSFLPEYPVPKNLKERVYNGSDIFTVQPELKEDLSEKNYVCRFAGLLYLSELNEEAEVNALQIRNVVIRPPKKADGFFEIKLTGVIASHSTIEVGDVIRISGPSITKQDHKGFIHGIDKSSETIHVSFNEKLLDTLKSTDRFVMSFSYSRIPFRRAHNGIRLAYRIRKDFLFPKSIEGKADNRRRNNKKSKFYDARLNKRQRLAVERMQASCTEHLPYILFGPPGTGKTVTLTELIIQLLKKDLRCRLLVCAPSNNAVDTLCLKLHRSGQVHGSLFTRFNSLRHPESLQPKELLTYCRNDEPLSKTVRFVIVFSCLFYCYCFNAFAL